MPEKTPLTQIFSKCANYSVMSILIANTIKSMSRFKNIPQDELLTRVYSVLKAKSTK